MTEQQEAIVLSFLEGKLTPQQLVSFEAWLNESAENRTTFEEYQKIWKATAPQKSDFQTQQEWQRLSAALRDEAQHIDQQREPARWFMRVAASIVFLLVCGGVAYFGFIRQSETVVIASDALVSVHLPDGSSIVLNKGSRLAYSEGSFADERQVSLQGEAFFDIVKAPQSPFTIEASKGMVKVLGTSFNVRAYSNDSTMEVFVVTGRVSLSSSDKKNELILNPGEAGILNSRAQLTKSSDANALAWKERKLVFRKTSLQKVARSLKSYFQIDLRFKDSGLEQCHFTGSFDDPTIEEVIESLQLALDLQVEKKDKTYILQGPGCAQ